MLTVEQLRELVRSALATRGEEIGCPDCFARLDRFVELHLAGQDASQVLPLVRQHLAVCGECQEEFETLLEALKAQI